MSPGVTHPGGVVLVPKQPLGSPPVASVHSPRRHPHVGSPGSTRWHACHQPLAHACRCAAGPSHGQTRASRVRHTGVVTAARSGDGGGGAGADVPPCPHTGPTVPPAPRWHVPAQNPRRLAGAGGVTRTRCPCTHPHGRGDWSRGPGAGGGGQQAPSILPPAPSASTPHSAPSPAARCLWWWLRGGGGSRELLPARWMGGIKPDLFHYRPQSPEPWLLSSWVREGLGGGTASPAPWSIPLPPGEETQPPPALSPVTHITGRLGDTHTHTHGFPRPPPTRMEQLKALLGGGRPGKAPPRVTAG